MKIIKLFEILKLNKSESDNRRREKLPKIKLTQLSDTLVQVLIITKHSRQRGKGFRLSWHVSNDHRQSGRCRAGLYLLLRCGSVMEQSQE